MEERNDFYANAVNVVTSIYDVTLNFRTQSPVSLEPGKDPLLEASGICNVRMSPQHAKALAALLIKHITKYEEDYQLDLPLPDDIAPMWQEHVKGS